VALDGLQPGRAVNLKVMPGTVSDEIRTIVLCSVDPESALGSKRFGIGAKSIN
jgi:hypothetical protein